MAATKVFGRRTLAAALALAATSVLAGRTTQTLGVSATVSPSALVGFEMSAQPLAITAADLDRGYVEVVMKSRMRVPTPSGATARPSVVMELEPRSDMFRSVGTKPTPDVNGHGDHGANGHSSEKPSPAGVSTATASDPGHDITSAGEVSEFRYRFEFSRTASEGNFPNAISVTVEL